MKSARIRPLLAGDLPAVLSLWTRAGIELGLSDRLEELRRVLDRNPETCLGAWDAAGTLIAAALGTFDGRRGNLWHLAVAPERRGEGIGRALMEAIEDVWRREGVVKITFTVVETNRKVLGFYEALGYQGRQDIFCVSKVLREE